jgi:dienelactone hydrolase
MRRLKVVIAAVIGFAGVAATHQAAAQGREQMAWVPMADTPQGLYTRICRPASEAPARVVIVAHGSPPSSSARPGMTPISCDSEVAQWFLQRGYVVIAAMRRGYGQTGGAWAEDYSDCANADYARGGQATAQDLAATVEYAASLPFARPQGMVLVGQSAGGWGSIAYDAYPHPRVTAIVNMSGGRGGHHNNQPNSNCRPDALAEAAGKLARGASTPMLWVYASNDSFFGPQLAAAMYAAYAQNGGRAEFQALGPFGNDGHGLFFGRGGSAIWGPLIDRYLATRPAQ